MPRSSRSVRRVVSNLAPDFEWMDGEVMEPPVPKGKFRVKGFDTFDPATGWFMCGDGDFDSLKEAKRHADRETRKTKMLLMHVYDDEGKVRYDAGTY